MNDFIHIYPFFDNKVLFRFYYSFSPLQYWRVYISISYSVWFINRFQSPSMLGWSISVFIGNPAETHGFSPLRCWGGLYLIQTRLRNIVEFQSPSILGWSISILLFPSSIRLSFSPLRYWGGLYHHIRKKLPEYPVLVPFDIGVVYIIINGWRVRNIAFQSPSILGWSISKSVHSREYILGFSPLRYWGGLYHNTRLFLSAEFVLVPFDIGVVYINKIMEVRKMNEFQSPSILGWSISIFLSSSSEIMFQSPSILGWSISV